ncbi:MAG: VOC family protein [Lachnospiraceae bacterium]
MRIEHAALYVHDLEQTRDFFVTYFHAVSNGGYHNTSTGFRSYFLTFDGGARLEVMTRPALADAESSDPKPGYDHLAFSVGDKDAVDAMTGRLREDGYQVLSGPRTTGDGYYESVILGPEGLRIEITV